MFLDRKERCHNHSTAERITTHRKNKHRATDENLDRSSQTNIP